MLLKSKHVLFTLNVLFFSQYTQAWVHMCTHTVQRHTLTQLFLNACSTPSKWHHLRIKGSVSSSMQPFMVTSLNS